MDRVRFIEYRGTPILLSDLSGIRETPDLQRAVRLGGELLRAQPPRSVLVLVDVTGVEYSVESFAIVQDALEAGDDPTPVQRQRLRQATTYATRVATAAVRFAYTAAGTDALRPGVLQRCFRDLHASTQHLVVDNNTLTETTRVLLGLDG